MEYQLIIIGSGPGGYEAALRAAELGLKTALVEKRDIGGTCLNRGCIPTKALLHASERVAEARSGSRFGVNAQLTALDIPALFAWKQEISSTLRQGVEGLLEQAGVDVYRGAGTLLSPGRVSVSGGQEVVLTGEHVILASGSVPSRPPIPGLDLDGVLTSDELLEGSDHLYGSLVIIGGGVIGVELATCFSNLGTKVTVLEGMSRLLPGMDRELGQNVAAILKKQGVSVAVNAKVTGVERAPDGSLQVAYASGAETGTALGEHVLCAIGRVPCTDGLLGDGVTLEMEGRRIRVNERWETSMPGVYAIGDVSSRIQLAHAATAQGRSCVEYLVGKVPVADPSVIPSGVYCNPEIACVGLTAEEAKEAGLAVETGKYVMFSNGRTLINGGPRSFMKVVGEKGSHRIVGAQLMCERATDMISQFTQAIVNHLTVEELLRSVRPHPTFEEGTAEALRALLKKL